MPGLSLIVYEPLSEQGLYAREFVDDVTANHERWIHTIKAVGGYDSASFALGGMRDYLDDWFDDGLMRRIVLFNPEAIPVWEGFVSRMRYTIGTLQKTKTIDNMYNRVYLKYAPLDFSVFPPVAGVPVTHQVDDPASQAKWGVKSVVVSGGERVDATIAPWAWEILQQSKDIQVGESVNTQAATAPSIEVECKGYYHTLKWLPHESASTAYIQAHQAIQEVLGFFNDTNPGWISQDFGWMDYNFAREPRGRDGLLSCWDVIANIVRQGGLGGERWVGGLYQDRKMVYKPAEDFGTLYGEYIQLWRWLEDPSQRIYDDLGTEVKPWDMVPDRVLRTVDVKDGLMYIEQVTFRESYGLQLVGGDDERLEVFLAQRGLPGV